MSSKWKERGESAEAVVARVKSHDRVFLHGACATSTPLIGAMSAREDVKGVNLYHLHLAGELGFEHPDKKDRFF